MILPLNAIGGGSGAGTSLARYASKGPPISDQSTLIVLGLCVAGSFAFVMWLKNYIKTGGGEE